MKITRNLFVSPCVPAWKSSVAGIDLLEEGFWRLAALPVALVSHSHAGSGSGSFTWWPRLEGAPRAQQSCAAAANVAKALAKDPNSRSIAGLGKVFQKLLSTGLWPRVSGVRELISHVVPPDSWGDFTNYLHCDYGWKIYFSRILCDCNLWKSWSETKSYVCRTAFLVLEVCNSAQTAQFE